MRPAHIFTLRWTTFVFCVLTVSSAAQADWPNFRGPDFDGISDEKNFIIRTTEPLKLLWEREIGSAFSSFAAVGNRIYTCGMGGGQQILYSLDADTGELIWKKPFEQEYRESHGDGTRATPTVDEGRVYILGARGRLLVVDAETGEEMWSRQFNHMPTWAYSGSVLIEGDLAIASGGGDDGALVAMDKRTGEIVWKAGDDPVGYAMPYPFTFNGQRYIAGFMGESAIIVEVKTGREVWRMPWKTSWDVNAAMPIFHDGHLFLGSGYTTGGAVLRLRPDGDRLVSETVWKSKVLLNKFQSCVLHEGHLYTSDERGFKSVDFLTGELKWIQRPIKNSPLILADGHLIVLTEDGHLQIGKVSPDGFDPTLSAEILSGRCWSLPVIHRGRLYVRNLDRAVCFDLRRE